MNIKYTNTTEVLQIFQEDEVNIRGDIIDSHFAGYWHCSDSICSQFCPTGSWWSLCHEMDLRWRLCYLWTTGMCSAQLDPDGRYVMKICGSFHRFTIVLQHENGELLVDKWMFQSVVGKALRTRDLLDMDSCQKKRNKSFVDFTASLEYYNGWSSWEQYNILLWSIRIMFKFFLLFLVRWRPKVTLALGFPHQEAWEELI